jgi:hypothetical protein
MKSHAKATTPLKPSIGKSSKLLVFVDSPSIPPVFYNQTISNDNSAFLLEIHVI